MMPTLEEVLTRFPTSTSSSTSRAAAPRKANALAVFVKAHPQWRNAIWASYGGAEPTNKSIELIDGLRGYTSKSMMKCLLDYELTGWTGAVPGSCRNTIVVVPSNFAWAVWGWPHKFTRRMEEAGSTVIMLGPFAAGDAGSTALIALRTLAQSPKASPAMSDQQDRIDWTGIARNEGANGAAQVAADRKPAAPASHPPASRTRPSRMQSARTAL